MSAKEAINTSDSGGDVIDPVKKKTGLLDKVGGVGAVAGAGLAAASAIQANSALADATKNQLQQVQRAGFDRGQRRSQAFTQESGIVQNNFASTSGVSQNAAAALVEATQNAAVDVSIINEDTKAQLDAIKAQFNSSVQNPFLAGASALLG